MPPARPHQQLGQERCGGIAQAAEQGGGWVGGVRWTAAQWLKGCQALGRARGQLVRSGDLTAEGGSLPPALPAPALPALLPSLHSSASGEGGGSYFPSYILGTAKGA